MLSLWWSKWHDRACEVCASVISGVFKLAAVVFALLLAVVLAFQLLEINMDFSLGSLTCTYGLDNKYRL